jgi:6-phosphogluconolactonase (cycloisomerase 2 family)
MILLFLLTGGLVMTHRSSLRWLLLAGVVAFLTGCSANMSPRTTASTSAETGSGGGSGDPAFLYVGTDVMPAIEGYSVDTGSASLTEVPGSPYSEAGAGPVAVIVNKGTVYSSSTDESTTSGAPFPTGTSTIRWYSADGTSGALTQTGSLTVPTTQAALFPEPTGHNLYDIDGNGAIRTLTINGDGSLTATGSPVTLAGPAVWLAVSPDGSLMYATIETGENQDATWAINRDSTTGALTPSHQVSSDQHLYNEAFDASGRYLLSEWANQISVDAVDESTGNLTPVAGSPFTTPRSLTESGDTIHSFELDPSGRFVYVLSFGSNLSVEYITVFSLAQPTGALTPVQTYDLTPGNPASLVADATLVYEVNYSGSTSGTPGSINVFRRDPTSGMLSAGGNSVTVQNGPDQSAILHSPWPAD